MDSNRYQITEFPTLDQNFKPLPQFQRRGWEPLTRPTNRRGSGTALARKRLKAGSARVRGPCRPRPEFSAHWNDLYAGCPLPVAPLRPGFLARITRRVTATFTAFGGRAGAQALGVDRG